MPRLALLLVLTLVPACHRSAEPPEPPINTAHEETAPPAPDSASEPSLGCADDELVFHCHFDAETTGVSVCAGRTETAELTIVAHLPDESNYSDRFAPEDSEQIFFCEYTSPHRTRHYATFDTGTRLYRIEYDHVSDSHYGGWDEDDDDGDLASDEANDSAAENPSRRYSLTIRQEGQERSHFFQCESAHVDHLPRLMDFHQVRHESQSC